MSNGMNKVQSKKKAEQQAQQKFQDKVDQATPKPPFLKNLCWAFIVGGLICVLGQAIADYFIHIGLGKKDAAACATAVLVFLGSLFTGLGLYDKLGKRAGAGSIVPITGFANSIVAPAMEFKREGYVFGIGAKMFVIAGPVLVYGLVTAFIVGLIYWARH
ncbi:MAG: stage V sporulation protein AC [Sporomusaceae bacterium]|nr:stage V sporulation protein AC [Sporomusaceae bacterium]